MKKISFVFSIILLNIIISYRFSDVLIVDFSKKNFTHETIKLFSDLKTEESINVDVFYGENNKVKLSAFYSLAENYLPSLKVRFFDADYNPEKVRRHNITSIPASVIEYKNRKFILNEHNELKFVNSILSLIRQQKKRIVFLTGQGQSSISDESGGGVSHLIDKVDFKVFDFTTIDILGLDKIEGNDLVVSIGQTRDFSDEEFENLLNARSNGADFIFLIDPYFNELERKNLNSFLRDYNLKTKPGFIKLNKNFVNGSDGLAPLFNNHSFYGAKINRAFFPFSTVIFGDEDSRGIDDFVVKGKDGAFVRDIKLANVKGLELTSKENMFLSRKSKVVSNKIQSNIFLVGNSTFVQNKFKNTFDSKSLFNNILKNASEDIHVNSLNIPLSQESEIFLGKKLSGLVFFSIIVLFLIILLIILNIFLRPSELVE